MDTQFASPQNEPCIRPRQTPATDSPNPG